MSWFDDVFGGGGQSAAQDMNKGYQQSIDAYQKYLQNAQNTLNPYIQQGQHASNNSMGMSDEMMNQFMSMMHGGGYQNPQLGGQSQNGLSQNGQPGGSQGTWMDNYNMSPMAKYHMQQGMNTGEAAAAASGMIGSNANTRGLMNMANDISSQDQQQFYNNMMGLGNAAQAGYGPQMQYGAAAGGQLANFNMDTGRQIGNSYQNQGMANAYGDQSRSSGINNAISAAAQFIPGYGYFKGTQDFFGNKYGPQNGQ